MKPVSILSSVSKIFEKVMYNQIYFFIRNKLFYISQYGFRSNHSTEFEILEVVNKIMRDMDNNKVPITIYFTPLKGL